MKHYKLFAAAAIFSVLLTACKKDFLDRIPKDQLVEQTAFITYEQFKAYAWQFYETFPAYDISLQNQEANSDLMTLSNPNFRPQWIWQTVNVPSSSNDYSGPYRRIRAINIMLENIESSSLTDTDKKHWRGVGSFFKAYEYSDLLNKYGGVTWLETAISESDTAVLFAPRDSRDTVAARTLRLLEYAVANIKTAGDGFNTVTPNVARALISRFGLREGTWRKYHNLENAGMYLNASKDASTALLTSFPNLHPEFHELFTSESLNARKIPEILLFKNYVVNQVTHTLSTWARSSSGRHDITKKGADMYLLTDGQTRWTSPLFQSDTTAYVEYRNRDKRWLQTTSAPYKITLNNSTTYSFTNNPIHREYFPLMVQLSKDTSKRLPSRNWGGLLLSEEPHFFDFNYGQPFNGTYTGYRLTKFSTHLNTGISSRDINDAPIFRMGEIFANHAEVMYELGLFDQAVANQTINKLRARGGVATLTLASIPEDPTRDPNIEPVLWEIRRERAVELMGEGFRWDDLRRWKKMNYAVARKLGRWIRRSEYGNRVPTLNNTATGYVAYEAIPPQDYPDHYYLFPIPSDQIVLNPRIAQNPGWK